MKGMRNAVAHPYGVIDYRIVWRTSNSPMTWPRSSASSNRIEMAKAGDREASLDNEEYGLSGLRLWRPVTH